MTAPDHPGVRRLDPELLLEVDDRPPVTAAIGASPVQVGPVNFLRKNTSAAKPSRLTS
jgi:hypothetical protein